MLIHGQFFCFLGPTIFKIPQPNWLCNATELYYALGYNRTKSILKSQSNFQYTNNFKRKYGLVENENWENFLWNGRSMKIQMQLQNRFDTILLVFYETA